MFKQLGEEALRDVLDTLKSTKSFVVSQAPDVCKEILEWGVVSSIFTSVLGLALFSVGICLLEEHDVWAVIVGCVGIFMFFASLYEITQIKIAPKLYLMEKIADMLKGESE